MSYNSWSDFEKIQDQHSYEGSMKNSVCKEGIKSEDMIHLNMIKKMEICINIIIINIQFK